VCFPKKRSSLLLVLLFSQEMFVLQNRASLDVSNTVYAAPFHNPLRVANLVYPTPGPLMPDLSKMFFCTPFSEALTIRVVQFFDMFYKCCNISAVAYCVSCNNALSCRSRCRAKRSSRT